MKIEYKIGFYNRYNNIILSSDFTLYNNLHIFCFIEIINKGISNIIINSIPNIEQNNYFKCTEFYYIYKKIKIGITISQSRGKNENSDNNQIIIDEKYFNVNKLIFKTDEIFDFLIIKNKY